MSGEVSNSVASSASVRFLSANWPIWLPMVASISRSSASGRPISRLKNSRTPMTSLPIRTGAPSAARRPARATIFPRGKLGSWMTSGAKKGSAVFQTRPGRPIPGTKVICRLAASSSGKLTPGAVQVSTHRRTPWAASTRHRPA